VSFGSGARDTTRLAAGSPELWVEVLRYNAGAVGAALERTEEQIAELRRLLSSGDVSALRAYLEAARAFRQGIER
jgi:prephenate dehydrogenase